MTRKFDTEIRMKGLWLHGSFYFGAKGQDAPSARKLNNEKIVELCE